MKTKQYKVGDHVFEIQFVDDNNDESLLPSFRPFELKDSDDVPLFRVIVDDSFKFDELGHEIGQFDCGGSNHGVYLLPNGAYQFVVTDVNGVLCCHMQSTSDFNEIKVAIKGKTGCDLMNDDNPVVRVVDGKAIIYGSPWSGKTPCYRNIQAPIGAIVRIQQRPKNEIRKLGPVESFTVLLPAMSNMKWDSRVYKGICDGITGLIEHCNLYELGCLPNGEAAILCHDTVSVN